VDFEALYRATYPRVLAYARTMAPRDDADDAVAETYAIARRRQRDIPRGVELGWLIGVTRRVPANARRSRRRAGALHALLDRERAAPGPDPAALVADGALRAARPATAAVDDAVRDDALLRRVRTLPVARRRRVPRSVALPAVAGAAAVATAAVMLGGPSDVGGPSAAGAITQTLRWLTPPPGTILHVRSVATQGGRATTHELWESADHPAQARELVRGAQTFEQSGAALYDPATNAIYERSSAPAAKAGTAQRSVRPAEAELAALPAADPVVDKVRILLRERRMTVSGRVRHDGVDAFAISLRPDAGRPVWTLWVAAADGRPLELRDPGRDASEQPQVIRWPVYEILPGGAAAAALVTLRGAHPTARVVRDPAAVDAALRRLLPPSG
jgi:DNA-directed RNA polymerase specialized sigma24 family protein